MLVRHRSLGSLAVLGLAACAAPPAEDTAESTVAQDSRAERCGWTQWGQNAAHDGAGCVRAQPLATQRAHLVIDPFVDQEVAEVGRGPDGPLFTHYQVPLTDGDDVFVLRKTGTFPSCDPPGSHTPAPCGLDAFDRQTWTERALRWRHGELEERWVFESDWKPPQLRSEEMFQPALSGRHIYIPGAGGSVFKVDARSGHLVKRIAPLGPTLDPRTYVWGGIAADRRGNIYYNVVALGPTATDDVAGAWLIKIDDRDRVSRVDYTHLIPGAPAPTDSCVKTFATTVPRPLLPWPPPNQPDGSPTLPDHGPCGSQAPGLNVTPAIGRDGTIFTATRAQQSVDGASFVVALHPNLTLKWAASLTGLLDDGCGIKASFCRAGATTGVDPSTNLPPAARVSDASSSSPIALPDGSVAYPALTIYNGGRGHLMKLDPHGHFLGSYDFGWDVTPAVYEHDGTYSIVTKDNVYDDAIFKISQIDADLALEWSFTATNPLTCERAPDGTVQCVDTGEWPTGFEWCMSAPAVDRNGTVFGTSEDGNIYAIRQGGTEAGRFFLDRTRGAVYTPTALDDRGRIYALNNGELFVIGN